MGIFDLRQFQSAEELARSAAGDWRKELSTQPAAGAKFCVALSGGRIAGRFFAAFAAGVKDPTLALRGVHFFWGDERCVPPDDPESNFRLAKEHLFIPLGVPDSQIHRVAGERSPDAAAAATEAELRSLAPPGPQGQPILDLVFLGMGEDGHVASLFPGEPKQVIAATAVFRPVRAAKPPPARITLGYAAIAAARRVWVLASGARKAQALRASLDPDGSTPLARVLQMRSHTTIYSDITLEPAGRGSDKP